MHVLLITIFGATFGLDRVSKSALPALLKMNPLGPIRFETHSNPGFILQTLSQTSPLARIMFISSLYGFLLFGFFLLLNTLPKPFKELRIGLTLFFSAITSNSFDRAFEGAVLDFITLTTETRLFYFNLADVFMWVGAGLILHSLFKTNNGLWHPNSKRKKYLVDASYQFKFAFKTALVAFCTTLILILFSYTFMIHGGGTSPENAKVYLVSTTLLGITFTLITFFTAVVQSHQSTGALYAFEKYVDSLVKGESATFQLRKSDEHQNLIPLAEKLKLKISRGENNET